MTLWRGALRSESPLGSQPQKTRPVPHARDVVKHGSTLQASRADASESRKGRKALEADAHTSQEERADIAQKVLPHFRGVEGQSSKQQHGDEQPAREQLYKTRTPLQGITNSSTAHAAPLPEKEEHPTPALSPSLCQHLKQRYLPVYSVFDERGNTVCNLGGLDYATCPFWQP